MVRRVLLLLGVAPALCFAVSPFLTGEFAFPPEKIHNHFSSIVQLPGGDLFLCWYHGSGERKADDVKVEASRLRRGSTSWEPRFTLADTPDFPDTNPALFVDSHRRLWLLWPLIVANEWNTAVMKYRIYSKYQQDGTPPMDFADTLFFIPRNFEPKVRAVYGPMLEAATPSERARMERAISKAGDKYFSRMGWMTRAHPLELPSGRVLVPLYSDGYDFSIIAISDNGGLTWSSSEPLVGAGNVQPSLVRRNDGAIVAYMRDNGPEPKRVMVSTSHDDGVTWSAVEDTDIPNPGAGLEIIRLQDGLWCLVNNDTERGRHSLAVWLSADEGKTWKWKRHLELEPSRKGSFSYPSMIQASDGTLHVSYSHSDGARQQTIKHAHFNVEWIKAAKR